MDWSKIGSATTGGIKLIFKNLQTSLLIVAVAAAGIFGYLYNIEVEHREDRELASEKLPPGILAKYVQKNRELIKLVKDLEGNTKVERIYIPDEGKVTIITKEKEEALKKYNELLVKLRVAKEKKEIEEIRKLLNELLGEIYKPPIVITKTKGFTSRFGGGFIFNPRFSTRVTGKSSLDLPLTLMLDWKFGYWNRWSSLVQVNPYFVGPSITYHVDRFTWLKKLHMNNLELGVTGGPGWSGGKYYGIALRSNF